MEIEFYQKNIYGRTMYFVNDKLFMSWFYDLTGRKTIMLYDMESMTKLFGVTFKEVIPPKNEKNGN